MKKIKTILPVIAGGVCLAEALFLPNSSAHPAAEKPYFSIILLVILILTAFLFLMTFFSKKFEDKYSEKAPFYAGILAFLAVLNILTVKTATLPVLYFPSLDRVFGVLVEEFPLLESVFFIL